MFTWRADRDPYFETEWTLNLYLKKRFPIVLILLTRNPISVFLLWQWNTIVELVPSTFQRYFTIRDCYYKFLFVTSVFFVFILPFFIYIHINQISSSERNTSRIG